MLVMRATMGPSKPSRPRVRPNGAWKLILRRITIIQKSQLQPSAKPKKAQGLDRVDFHEFAFVFMIRLFLCSQGFNPLTEHAFFTPDWSVAGMSSGGHSHDNDEPLIKKNPPPAGESLSWSCGQACFTGSDTERGNQGQAVLLFEL